MPTELALNVTRTVSPGWKAEPVAVIVDPGGPCCGDSDKPVPGVGVTVGARVGVADGVTALVGVGVAVAVGGAVACAMAVPAAPKQAESKKTSKATVRPW
jgi:hypothetical protein